MLAELNKYGIQCSTSSPSGWTEAQRRRQVFSVTEGWGHTFTTRDSTL